MAAMQLGDFYGDFSFEQFLLRNLQLFNSD